MDQWNNSVDGEIRIPVKGWEPLGRNSWIEKVDTYTPKDGSQKPPAFTPLDTRKEWGIALADGSIEGVLYETEGEARQELQYKCVWLAKLGVPEEYWPVLMERDVETVATSWRILSV